MKPIISAESYAIVEKLAYKFAYGNSSYKYEEYLNKGLEGLIKAINNYKEDTDADFATYATTCIRNEMCTKKKQMERFDLQQDENVDFTNYDGMVTEMADDNMADIIKSAIYKANKGNERNSEMVMLHIGLNGEEPMDYKELSAKFNVSAERVRQVYVNTISTIKANENTKELLYSFVG